MLSQPPMWLIFLAFICAIGPLVFIHELGHYLVARWFGVGAETFSIGFGREILGWKDKRGTRWKVGWLPLGGYVRFAGDADAASTASSGAPVPSDVVGHAFHDRPVGQRFLIVLAGPMANFLLAILIIAAFFATVGMPRTPNLVDRVVAGSPAERAGIRAGDRIESIDGQDTPTFEALRYVTALRPGAEVAIRVDRGGEILTIQARLGAQVFRDEFGQSHRLRKTRPVRELVDDVLLEIRVLRGHSVHRHDHLEASVGRSGSRVQDGAVGSGAYHDHRLDSLFLEDLLEIGPHKLIRIGSDQRLIGSRGDFREDVGHRYL